MPNDAVTAPSTLRLLCWNMAAGSPGATQAYWEDVERQREELDVDIALLQEAPDLSTRTDLEPHPGAGSSWGIGRNHAQAAIARLSERVELTAIPTMPLNDAGPLELGVSRPGTLAVATMRVLDTGEEINVASVYGQWEGPITGGTSYYSDGSMHRILSDLSPLLSWSDTPLVCAITESRDRRSLKVAVPGAGCSS